MRAYKLPNPEPGEGNWDYCLRAAASIPPEEMVRMLLKHMHATRKRNDRQPLWLKVGEATMHGSGISSAIVAHYVPELGAV